jgi:uncharacterized protein YrrD
VSDSFRQALGRKVVSRDTAHQLGVVAHLLPTPDCRRVAAVVIGRGKKAQLVDWDRLSGFGADAVMVSDETALRAASDDREQRAGHGKLELLGSRALSESGNELGRVDDIMFDPATGAVETLAVAGRQVPAEAVLGAGSYAVVLDASQDPA